MKDNTKFPRGVEVVVAPIIENNNGEILLTRSPKWNNKWTLPGGHVEPGETLTQAIIRENKEELDIETEVIKIIKSGELINSKDFQRPAHFIYFDIYCKINNSNKDIKLDNKELSDYKWLKPEESLKLDLAESYRETVEEFIKLKNKN